ncbi:MAG TPA: efflux RND transporter periplasmic adaptor subunit [Pirellulales bacterium]|jgi:RND family efflux transporter MFP subunit|nr:efflux RND transporter periplasmic adaptor subunit [Pirellulales bacterium]
MNAVEPDFPTTQASLPAQTDKIATAPPATPQSASQHPGAEEVTTVRPWRSVWVIAIVLLLVVALAGLAVTATLPRIANERNLDAAAAQVSTAKPRVTVAQARRPAATADRVLPGNALAVDNAAIFARTTGYVQQRMVDIGDRVKAGQVMAVISAPQIDDQLRQNQANLAQAKANVIFVQASHELAVAVHKREAKAGGAITQEQLDIDQANVDTTAAQIEVAKAAVDVNAALVQQFVDLQGFEKIMAPFDGVVTARHFDVGDLMTADTPSSTKQMLEIQRTDILRVHVDVPQVYATTIKVGRSAVVFRRESPAEQFTGTVTRTANALDPATRTLLTEVQVANPNDALRPGMFLQVKFQSPRGQSALLIPSAAILIRDNARQVAVLDDQHRVSYRKVEMGRDFGTDIEILSGLHDGETVLVYPGDQLPVGTEVDPVPLARTTN